MNLCAMDEIQKRNCASKNTIRRINWTPVEYEACQLDDQVVEYSFGNANLLKTSSIQKIKNRKK